MPEPRISRLSTRSLRRPRFTRNVPGPSSIRPTVGGSRRRSSSVSLAVASMRRVSPPGSPIRRARRFASQSIFVASRSPSRCLTSNPRAGDSGRTGSGSGAGGVGGGGGAGRGRGAGVTGRGGGSTSATIGVGSGTGSGLATTTTAVDAAAAARTAAPILVAVPAAADAVAVAAIGGAARAPEIQPAPVGIGGTPSIATKVAARPPRVPRSRRRALWTRSRHATSLTPRTWAISR
jgi:hypothetical protein